MYSTLKDLFVNIKKGRKFLLSFKVDIFYVFSMHPILVFSYLFRKGDRTQLIHQEDEDFGDGYRAGSALATAGGGYGSVKVKIGRS